MATGLVLELVEGNYIGHLPNLTDFGSTSPVSTSAGEVSIVPSDNIHRLLSELNVWSSNIVITFWKSGVKHGFTKVLFLETKSGTTINFSYSWSY